MLQNAKRLQHRRQLEEAHNAYNVQNKCTSIDFVPYDLIIMFNYSIVIENKR
jgi:hypothetical protein